MIEPSDATPAPKKLQLTEDESRRLWGRITIGLPDECWNWTGHVIGKSPNDYGRLKIQGRETLAHRVSFQIRHRLLLPGECALHRCDNPRCCNPAHLFPGTQKQNVHDRIAKKRRGSPGGPSGETHPSARLKRSDVDSIRAQKGKESGNALAQKFGISRKTVYKIWGNRCWMGGPV